MADKDNDSKALGFGKIITHSTKNNRHTVYLNDTVSDFNDYHELIDLLRESSTRDKITLIIQNYGGDCHSCLAICNSIKASKASVMVEVIAPCYSAGSTLALAGNGLIMRPHSFLMFHDYSTTLSGKGGEVASHLDAVNTFVRGYMKEYHTPFLTMEEHKKIISGVDLYIHANDKSLKTRLKRHFKG